VPRSNLPAPTTGNGVAPGGGRETYTHGAFQQATGTIRDCLAAYPQALDAMLARLRAVDVGRSQAEGVIAYADHAGATAEAVGTMLDIIDGKVMPVVDSTQAAGGTDEVNSPRYYQEM
jgi:hypothetical protein